MGSSTRKAQWIADHLVANIDVHAEVELSKPNDEGLCEFTMFEGRTPVAHSEASPWHILEAVLGIN